MKFTQVITVLNVRRYSFEDDKKVIDGCKVTYLENWESVQKDNSRGVEILTSTLPLNAYSDFLKLPGLYNAEFSVRQGPKGIPLLSIDGVEFIEPYQEVKSEPKQR